MAYPLFLFIYMRIEKNGEEFVGSQTAKNNLDSAKWNSV
jgi:hypothetical protein